MEFDEHHARSPAGSRSRSHSSVALILSRVFHVKLRSSAAFRVRGWNGCATSRRYRSPSCRIKSVRRVAACGQRPRWCPPMRAVGWLGVRHTLVSRETLARTRASRTVPIHTSVWGMTPVDNSVDSSRAQPQKCVVSRKDADFNPYTTTLRPTRAGAGDQTCRSRSAAFGSELPRKDADLCLIAEGSPPWLSTHVRWARLGSIGPASTSTREAHAVARDCAYGCPVDNPVEDGGRGVPAGHHSRRSMRCGCRETAL